MAILENPTWQRKVSPEDPTVGSTVSEARRFHTFIRIHGENGSFRVIDNLRGGFIDDHPEALKLEPTDLIVEAEEMVEGYLRHTRPINGNHSSAFRSEVGHVRYFIDPEEVTRDELVTRGFDITDFPQEGQFIITKDNHARHMFPGDRILRTQASETQTTTRA